MKKLITIALAGLICFWLTALPVFSDPIPDPVITLDSLGMPVPPVPMCTSSSSTGTDTIVSPVDPWADPDK